MIAAAIINSPIVKTLICLILADIKYLLSGLLCMSPLASEIRVGKIDTVV